MGDQTSGQAVASETHGTDVVDLVNIEIIPVGKTEDDCIGGAVKLTRDEDGVEVSLMAAMSPPQCREIARRLLIIADAATGGAERTIMCVSATSMWKLPGQVLLTRYTADDEVRFEFAVDPMKNRMDQIHASMRKPKRGLVGAKPRLIIP